MLALGLFSRTLHLRVLPGQPIRAHVFALSCPVSTPWSLLFLTRSLVPPAAPLCLTTVLNPVTFGLFSPK